MTRRAMLGMGMLGAAFTATGISSGRAEESKGPTPAPHLKMLVCGGHPGDPEYGCGGTIARYSDLGHEVVLLYLNEGEPRGTPESKKGFRVAEAAKACAILKARSLFAGQMDGAAVVDAEHYRNFQRLLESENPSLVLTHWPLDNHADHRAVTMLVYEAWVRVGKRFALYFYEVSNGEDTAQFAPTDFVDISAVTSRKKESCFAHASQSPEKFYALQSKVTQFRGIESGHGEAESFIRHVQSPNHLTILK